MTCLVFWLSMSFKTCMPLCNVCVCVCARARACVCLRIIILLRIWKSSGTCKTSSLNSEVPLGKDAQAAAPAAPSPMASRRESCAPDAAIAGAVPRIPKTNHSSHLQLMRRYVSRTATFNRMSPFPKSCNCTTSSIDWGLCSS